MVLLGVLMLALVFVLSACGGGGGSTPGSTSATLAIKPLAGTFISGTVMVNAVSVDSNGSLAIGQQLGETETISSNGSVSLVSVAPGDILVTVTNGKYTDENGQVQNNVTLHTICKVTAGSQTVAVTPLTDVAYQVLQAQAQNGALSSSTLSSSINAANQEVSDQFSHGTIDIVKDAPLDTNATPTSGNLTAQQNVGYEYGEILGGLTNYAQTNAINPAAVITQIATNLNGNSGVLTAALGEALGTAITDYANQPPSITNGTTTGNAMYALMNGSSPTVSGITNDVSSGQAFVPSSENNDVANAKGLISDLRTTALDIYNNTGTGTPGIINTPITGASQYLQYVGKDMAQNIGEVAFVLQALYDNHYFKTYNQFDNYGNELFITPGSGTGTATFVINAPNYTTGAYDTQVASGTVTGSADSSDLFTSGTFSMDAPKIANATINYTGTASSGVYTSMKFIGKMTDEMTGAVIDLSQSGQGVSATFSQVPGTTSTATAQNIYPTSISLNADVVIPYLIEIDGSISMPTIVWNSNAYNHGGPVPTSVTLKGTVAQFASSTTTGGSTSGTTPTGAQFTGTLTASSSNIGSYNFKPGATSTSNFLMFSANFDGTIQATDMPTIEAKLGVSSSAYKQYSLSFSYERTNTDKSVVSLSGTGTYNEGTRQFTAALTNQNAINVNLSYNAGTKSVSGDMENSSGTQLATFSEISNVPMVKFIDGYMESAF